MISPATPAIQVQIPHVANRVFSIDILGLNSDVILITSYELAM